MSGFLTEHSLGFFGFCSHAEISDLACYKRENTFTEKGNPFFSNFVQFSHIQ